MSEAVKRATGKQLATIWLLAEHGGIPTARVIALLRERFGVGPLTLARHEADDMIAYFQTQTTRHLDEKGGPS